MNKLPKKIPIFPLSNFIIFPNTTVPLNIFEPRYIEMIDYSMKTNKFLGLIQPKKDNINSIDTNDILDLFNNKTREYVESNILQNSIYQLFPYSAHKYEPDKTLSEIQESTKNLNTRLSNLKKINKSLDTFEKDITSFNWDELQRISKELEEDYKDI